jgi:hypothetical protein
MEHDPISHLDGAKSPTARGTQDRQFDRPSIDPTPVSRKALLRTAFECELPVTGVTQFNPHSELPIRQFPGLTAAQLASVRADFVSRFPAHTPSQIEDRIVRVLSGREDLNPQGASARYRRSLQEAAPAPPASVIHELQATLDIPDFLRRSHV